MATSNPFYYDQKWVHLSDADGDNEEDSQQQQQQGDSDGHQLMPTHPVYNINPFRVMEGMQYFQKQQQ